MRRLTAARSGLTGLGSDRNRFWVEGGETFFSVQSELDFRAELDS